MKATLSLKTPLLLISSMLLASPAIAETCSTDVQSAADAPYAGEWSGNLACGRRSWITGPFSTAYGAWTTSVYDGASVFGYAARADAYNSTAIGLYAHAATNGPGEAGRRTGSTAVGAYTRAARGAVAIGLWVDLNNNGGLEDNERTVATNDGGVAIGAVAQANGFNSTAVGFRNTAASSGTAIGNLNTAGTYGTSLGYFNTSGFVGIAIGGSNTSSDNAIALGWNNEATAGYSLVIGHESRVEAEASTAIGYRAVATASNSVALGVGARADREYTISVGSAARMNQIVNLANGTQDNDAVNVSQLYPLATALGGGASYAGGVFTAPVYVIQSANYTDVGSAFAAVDAEITDINQRIVAAGGIQGERGYSAYELAVQNGYGGSEADWLAALQGPQGPSGPTGPEGPAGGGPRSVVYDSDERDTLTLAGANGTTLSNVANGVADMDAVNVRQMRAGDAATLQSARDHADAGDAATLQSANGYTDTVAVQTLESANRYTDSVFAAFNADVDGLRTEMDDRFRTQDRRIDRMGAMTSAMTNMAINAAGSQSPRGRIAVGAGFQGGEQALSIGYGRKIGSRGSFSIGGAFGGGEKSAGVGFGMDL